MVNTEASRSINARQHLTALGWAGPGHALDSHNGNRGLAKPLLITHKNNNRGLGSRSAKEKQADQWWLNAFDAALKQINTNAARSSNPQKTTLESVQQHGMNKGGLYGWFTRGEVLGSTFDEQTQAESFKPRKVQNDRRRSKKEDDVGGQGNGGEVATSDEMSKKSAMVEDSDAAQRKRERKAARRQAKEFAKTQIKLDDASPSEVPAEHAAASKAERKAKRKRLKNEKTKA